MKYVIARENGEVTAKHVEDTGFYLIHDFTDIVNHSPTGFEFGYGGSGPSQLALAILMDYLRDESKVENIYQDFKWKFIAPAQGQSFEITEEQIKEFLKGKV